jgi:lipopolysaccharide export system protein LptC
MNLSKPEPVAKRVLTPWQKARNLIDNVLAYIPVLLMGILAMLSYWLVRNTPAIQDEVLTPATRHEVDYFLKNFSVKTYQGDGHLQSVIFGEQANHFEDTQTLEIQKPRLHSIDKDNNFIRATANQAVTNVDGSELELIGEAVVIKNGSPQHGKVPTEDLELRSEFIDFLIDQDQIKTNQSVILKKGKDHFEAQGMEFDNTTQILKLKGQVKGSIEPKKKAS